MEFSGKVISKEVKNGTKKDGSGEWTSYTYVIQEDGQQYPQTGVFESFGDKIQELNEGNDVTVAYNLKANEYNEKWYNKLQIWKVSINNSSNTKKQNESSITEHEDFPF